jgi:hypothetical protein
MDIQLIQREVTKAVNAGYAHKSDKQLWVYQKLHDAYLLANKRKQPEALVRFNSPLARKCKLNKEQVKEIRTKFIPYVYGKKRLASEYGVSPSLILRILRGKSWKIFDDSS